MFKKQNKNRSRNKNKNVLKNKIMSTITKQDDNEKRKRVHKYEF